MQNSTQLRGIHLGLQTYANSNKDQFPGLDSNGVVLGDGVDTGHSGDGDTVEARYWILLDASFITPDFTISPSETELRYDWTPPGPVTLDNYSYAMLQVDGQPGSPIVGDPKTPCRAQEWSQTLNSQAVVMADRNLGPDANSNVWSIHSGQTGQWEGSILWNDGHVAFEQTHVLPMTQYGGGPSHHNDNLFEAAGDTDADLIYTGDQ